jgi:hypothetical protein
VNLHKKATFCSAASELSQEEGYEFILRKEEIFKDWDTLSTQPRKKRGK